MALRVELVERIPVPHVGTFSTSGTTSFLKLWIRDGSSASASAILCLTRSTKPSNPISAASIKAVSRTYRVRRGARPTHARVKSEPRERPVEAYRSCLHLARWQPRLTSSPICSARTGRRCATASCRYGRRPRAGRATQPRHVGFGSKGDGDNGRDGPGRLHRRRRRCRGSGHRRCSPGLVRLASGWPAEAATSQIAGSLGLRVRVDGRRDGG
jgi:hypothetical protein